MAHPSSSQAASHEAGLAKYRHLGGDCIHLHGEGGGETHSRYTTGQWLRTHHLRPEFFVCTQICHDQPNVSEGRPREISSCCKTEYLDLVYLDDNSRSTVGSL